MNGCNGGDGVPHRLVPQLIAPPLALGRAVRPIRTEWLATQGFLSITTLALGTVRAIRARRHVAGDWRAGVPGQRSLVTSRAFARVHRPFHLGRFLASASVLNAAAGLGHDRLLGALGREAGPLLPLARREPKRQSTPFIAAAGVTPTRMILAYGDLRGQKAPQRSLDKGPGSGVTPRRGRFVRWNVRLVKNFSEISVKAVIKARRPRLCVVCAASPQDGG